MASEWSTKTLRQAGVTLIDCDHRTPAAAETGYPYIAIPQLKDGRIDLTGVRRISLEDYLAWTTKLKPREHDVVVVRRCNSGDSAVVPADLECAIGQNLVVLRADGECVLPEFLRWLTRGPDWWGQVNTFINVGAVFDSLKCKEIPSFEVRVPPLNDQRLIIEVLGSLDERANLLRQTNTTLEAIAQALFKSWFVDFDPVRAKAEGREPEGMDAATAALFPNEFEESEQGLIPKGWEVKRLGELIDLAYGKAMKASDRTPGDVPVYGSGGVTGTHDRSLVSGPTVIVGRKGSVGTLYWESRPCFPIDTVFYVKPKQIPLTFAFYAMQRLRLERMNTDAAVPGLNRDNAYRLPVVVSDADVLNAWNSISSVLRDRIEASLRQARSLVELRDALLPRLISGKLRLPEAEARIEEAAA